MTPTDRKTFPLLLSKPEIPQKRWTRLFFLERVFTWLLFLLCCLLFSDVAIHLMN